MILGLKDMSSLFTAGLYSACNEESILVPELLGLPVLSQDKYAGEKRSTKETGRERRKTDVDSLADTSRLAMVVRIFQAVNVLRLEFPLTPT